MLERRSNTVLVVEDNSVLSMMLTMLLTRTGYEVVSATNGRQALHYLNQKETPFVITLDLDMPVMGGEEFLRLRAEDPYLSSIPVILCSGSDVEEGRHLAAAYGVEFCVKPFKVSELLHLVEQHHSAVVPSVA